MDRRFRLHGAAVMAALALCCASAARAQDTAFPDHTIRIIVPYTPGGFNDTLARTVAQEMQADWKQPVVVDNRPGGATVIGINAVAKSPPDGYTLLITPFSFVVNPYIFAKLSYDPWKDFEPVTLAASTANVLVVTPSMPVKTVQELIAYAKSRPGSLNYASTGIGGSNHLSMEKFKQMTGIEANHVPYKGSAPAVTDVMSGQVQVLFDNTSNVLQQIRAGTLHALAITTAKRSPLLPEVPTLIESGVPGYEVGVWFGFTVPHGTPRPIVDKLNAEIVKILRKPEVKDKFAAIGVDSIGSTPEQFTEFMQAQSALWGKVVKDAGVKPE